MYSTQLRKYVLGPLVRKRVCSLMAIEYDHLYPTHDLIATYLVQRGP